jgi:hypothetical protein
MRVGTITVTRCGGCCTIQQLERSLGLALYIVLIDMSMYGAWQRTIAEIAIGMCPSTA